jgi:hypothetical protein
MNPSAMKTLATTRAGLLTGIGVVAAIESTR